MCGLVFSNGSITSSSSEQNLFDVTGDAHYHTYIFLHNMAAGDTIVIRVYVKDVNGSNTMRKAETITLSNAQTDPAGYLGYFTATQYKVTIQRTAGTDRSYTWLRSEVT